MNPEPLLEKVGVFWFQNVHPSDLRMIERIIDKNGEKITEVRSDGGKLLFIKTKKGYEMKCPRTKKICLVKYEEMLADCFNCFDTNFKEDENLLDAIKKTKMKI